MQPFHCLSSMWVAAKWNCAPTSCGHPTPCGVGFSLLVALRASVGQRSWGSAQAPKPNFNVCFECLRTETRVVGFWRGHAAAALWRAWPVCGQLPGGVFCCFLCVSLLSFVGCLYRDWQFACVAAWPHPCGVYARSLACRVGGL